MDYLPLANAVYSSAKISAVQWLAGKGLGTFLITSLKILRCLSSLSFFFFSFSFFCLRISHFISHEINISIAFCSFAQQSQRWYAGWTRPSSTSEPSDCIVFKITPWMVRAIFSLNSVSLYLLLRLPLEEELTFFLDTEFRFTVLVAVAEAFFFCWSSFVILSVQWYDDLALGCGFGCGFVSGCVRLFVLIFDVFKNNCFHDKVQAQVVPWCCQEQIRNYVATCIVFLLVSRFPKYSFGHKWRFYVRVKRSGRGATADWLWTVGLSIQRCCRREFDGFLLPFF